MFCGVVSLYINKLGFWMGRYSAPMFLEGIIELWFEIHPSYCILFLALLITYILITVKRDKLVFIT